MFITVCPQRHLPSADHDSSGEISRINRLLTDVVGLLVCVLINLGLGINVRRVDDNSHIKFSDSEPRACEISGKVAGWGHRLRSTQCCEHKTQQKLSLYHDNKSVKNLEKKSPKHTSQVQKCTIIPLFTWKHNKTNVTIIRTLEVGTLRPHWHTVTPLVVFHLLVSPCQLHTWQMTRHVTWVSILC